MKQKLTERERCARKKGRRVMESYFRISLDKNPIRELSFLSIMYRECSIKKTNIGVRSVPINASLSQ